MLGILIWEWEGTKKGLEFLKMQEQLALYFLILSIFFVSIPSLWAQLEGAVQVKTESGREEKQPLTQAEGWKCCHFIQEANVWGDR